MNSQNKPQQKKKDPLSDFGRAIPRTQVSQFHDVNEKVNWKKVLGLIFKLLEMEMMKMKPYKRFLIGISCIIPVAFIADGFFNLVVLPIYHLF